MVDPLRTVWILGSGFSKPLGGPVLNELLTERTVDELRTHYPSLQSNRIFPAAASLFIRGSRASAGVKSAHSQLSGGPFWENAEEFLEFLDRASVAESTEMATIARIEVILTRAQAVIGSSNDAARIENLRTTARSYRDEASRLVAMQCTEFTVGADTKSERWHPYARWAKQLKEDRFHSLITFNYDEVLELLGFEPLLPSEVDTSADVVPVALKLHGSVNWRQDGSCSIRRAAPNKDGSDLASCDASTVAIAPPGPSKLVVSSQHLARLWSRAEQAISSAHAVVFMGYRFPPTDSYALGRLLEAIQQNTTEQTLVVHVVLGPDTRHPDVLRLSALLEYALQNGGRRNELPHSKAKTYRVRVHPLWAQDFLALWTPALTWRTME